MELLFVPVGRSMAIRSSLAGLGRGICQQRVSMVLDAPAHGGGGAGLSATTRPASSALGPHLHHHIFGDYIGRRHQTVMVSGPDTSATGDCDEPRGVQGVA